MLNKLESLKEYIQLLSINKVIDVVQIDTLIKIVMIIILMFTLYQIGQRNYNILTLEVWTSYSLDWI